MRFRSPTGEKTIPHYRPEDVESPSLRVKVNGFNHTYVRRPVNASDPFYAFWADGDASQPSKSRLYFSDSEGQYWRLPYDMTEAFAEPIEQPGETEPTSVDEGDPVGRNEKMDGYRGVWFTLGQFSSEYGDKYSGGFGTYTMKHVPRAIYAEDVEKTFFTYGGTRRSQSEDERQDLVIMASYYDHESHEVPKPTLVEPKEGVVDPHDNASIVLDEEGYVWIFVSGRSRTRLGYKYRSSEPYSVDSFELVTEQEITYPQIWHVDDEFFHFFTKYTDGRELYWERSSDGEDWSADEKLAGMGGHYQTSGVNEGRIATAFNYHPGGSVDRRTNLYYLQTDDFGESWETVDRTDVDPPLTSPDNDALVRDYQSEDRLVYLNEMNFDSDGNPIVQYVTSSDYRPGPSGAPRRWLVSHWDGSEWNTNEITNSDHNYDAGSLYVNEGEWTVIGPTEEGPQEYHTGGNIAIWVSVDDGQTWEKQTQVTDTRALHALNLVEKDDSELRILTDDGIRGIETK